MKYLLSIYQPDGDPPPPEVLEPIMRDLDASTTRCKAAGAWVFAGGLHPPSTATVAALKDGDVLDDRRPVRSRARSTSAASRSSRRADLDAALEWGAQARRGRRAADRGAPASTTMK